MKITKFAHACLLVEMPAPINRTVLFDPGSYSLGVLDIDSLEYLDDIFITHEHHDHFSLELVKQLVSKFPDVRITAPTEVVAQLQEANIQAGSQPSEGVEFFDSPHEDIKPLIDHPPEEIGYHYLSMLSHPGDSHSFTETKDILALPVTAPWGSLIRAINLALELKPKHILPIHDYQWKDDSREQTYVRLEKVFANYGITFHKIVDGQPVVIE